ncbi:protein jag [Chloroflexota bacterium]
MIDNKQTTEIAVDTLQALLGKMGIEAKILVSENYSPLKEDENGSEAIILNMEGDDLGILIGRHGQTLDALQYLLRIITAQKTSSWLPIILDVEAYKQRRYQSLKTLALRIAEMVKIKKIPFKLEPLPAYERRIVHLTLADHNDVVTSSTGEGESRRVVVSPKRW